MLGKLVKYDLLFCAKRYGILFLLLVGAWLSGLAVSLLDIYLLNAVFLTINLLVSASFICAYIFSSLQFVYSALSSDESYFSYTIPVGTVQLVLSKLIVMWVWGAALSASLVASWFSLNATLLQKMELVFPVPEGLVPFLACIVAAHTLLMTCMLLFSVAMCNRPGLKRLNAGVFIVLAATYVLSQLVGLLELGVLFAVQYLRNGDTAFINRDMSLPADLPLIHTMQLVMTITPLLCAFVFVWMSVRSLAKRRSI